MPFTICPSCTTPHEPNEFAPYCCSRCRTFGRRRTANRSARPYSAADIERAQLRREVERARVTVDTQAALLRQAKARNDLLAARYARLVQLHRRLRQRFYHPRRWR